MALTYKKAGVDVAGIRRSQAEIGRLVASTHRMRGAARAAHGFGHYAGLVELPGGRLLATHTDGVGTKVVIASAMKRYDTVGIDCIAMNVNDVICTGAAPVSFVDYIAAARNDGRILRKIVEGLVAGAKKARVPIVGGETAIMPDVVSGGGFAFDLAGAVTGLVDRKNLVLGDGIRPGHVIIGAASTGIHSNGYSLARRALLGRYSLRDRVRGVGRIGDALLEPTAIYTAPVLEIAGGRLASGLAHITGGSFAKLLRLRRAGYEIDSLPPVPPIMALIAEQGVPEAEMYGTFNMGVGFCVIAPPDRAEEIIRIFKRHKTAAAPVGRVTSKAGVTVNSRRIA